MSAINDCDVILANAPVRYEPVMLPPSVIVPPGQLGPGRLPGGVNGSDGTPVASTKIVADTIKASIIYTDQIRDTAGNVMFVSGKLARENVSGLGVLAAKNSVTSAEVTGLGSLALLNRVSNTLVDGLGPFATAASIAASSVSGLGSLATLSKVDGKTQVTGLGTLAYKAAVFANELGAGTLAANVIYGGTIAADKVIGGSFEGKTFTGGTFKGGYFDGAIISANSLGSGTLFIDYESNLGSLNVRQNVTGPAFAGFLRQQQIRYCNIYDHNKKLVINGTIDIGALAPQ